MGAPITVLRYRATKWGAQGGAMLRTITNNFAALTVLGVGLAWFFPAGFTWMTDGRIAIAGQPLLSLALGVIMLAMGLTLTFDDLLSQQSAEDFVQETLVDGLHAKIVIVGEDFRFGAGGAGDVALLHDLGQQLGFEVRVIPSATEAGLKVSTSTIRELLDLGDVAQAGRLLGRVHTTVGIIEHGLKIGRTIGFPTANMSREA